MAFDINYIENYGSSNSIISWGTLIGTAFGFTLAQGATAISKHRQRNRIGNLFKIELIGSKSQFDRQIEAIIEVHEKLKLNEPTHLRLYLKQTFNTINSLDKLTIIEYYNNWWDKKFNKGKNNRPSLWITDVLGIIENVKLEMTRLEKWDDEFKDELANYSNDYANELNILLQEFNNKYSRAPKNVTDYDPVYKIFMELYTTNFITRELQFKSITLATLQENIIKFHGPITESFPYIETNPICQKVVDFNTKARWYIEKINFKRDWFIHSLQMVEKSLRFNYEKLYDEEYNSTKLTHGE